MNTSHRICTVKLRPKQTKNDIEGVFITRHPNPDKINPELESVIRDFGDEQNRTSNLICDMTRYEMHQFSPAFEKFGEWVNEIVCHLTDVDQVHMQNIWGAIYRKGEYALNHNHLFEDINDFPLASFCYMVNVTDECSPLVFPNVEMPWLPPRQIIYPGNGILAIWHPKHQHYVPPQYSDHERVVISGNVVDYDFPNKIPTYSQVNSNATERNTENQSE